jgi:DinB superfamily
MDSYLERLRNALATATRGMTSEELTNRPEGKWSVAEVLEHLHLTYTGTLKAFNRCLEAGKPLASVPSLKQRVAVVLVIELGRFPKGQKAPERTLPKGMPAEKVVADIGLQIAAMDKIIAQCEVLFGARTKVLNHPVLGPLTARQWRKFHWVHGRHHVKQIQKRGVISERLASPPN